MKSEIKGTFPYISFLTIFTVGNAVINLPFSKNINSSIFGLLTATLISFIIYLLICVIIKNNTTEKINNKSGKILAAFVGIYSIFISLSSMRNLITFFKNTIIKDTPTYITGILFIFLLFYITNKSENTIIKLSTICMLISAISLVVLFVLSFRNFSLMNLIGTDFSLNKGGLYHTISYLSLCFSSISIIPFFFSNYKGNNIKKSVNISLFTTLLFLLLVIILVVLIFGYSFSSTLFNPLASALSTITFGNQANRMEGFSYFIYFSFCLIKSAVSLKVARKITVKHFYKLSKYFYYIIGIIFFVFSAFISVFKNIEFNKIWYIFLLPAIFIIVFLFIRSIRKTSIKQ